MMPMAVMIILLSAAQVKALPFDTYEKCQMEVPKIEQEFRDLAFKLEKSLVIPKIVVRCYHITDK